MDPALHVRRGHGQRCVFSARGVGTVCARCVAEVLSLTAPEPLTQRDHASVLALATTRARYARALAELVRDPGAGPDVADAWGHVLVAACVDAIVADDANDPATTATARSRGVARGGAGARVHGRLESARGRARQGARVAVAAARAATTIARGAVCAARGSRRV